MEQRISLVTLGVADLTRAKGFYSALDWRGTEVEETVFHQAGGLALVLWDRRKLAADCGLADAPATGFGGIALAHNVRTDAEVDALLDAAARAGRHRHPARRRQRDRFLLGCLHRPRRPRLGDRPQPRLHPGRGRLPDPARLRPLADSDARRSLCEPVAEGVRGRTQGAISTVVE